MAAEFLFYHLTDTPLERTLPDLLERSLARGWKVCVRGGHADGLSRIDGLLWSYRDDSFLPHGATGGPHDSDQPILLCTSGNGNQADVLMLVDGARADPSDAEGFQRICLLFNGYEDQALSDARVDWKSVSDAGLTAVYWAREDGRWIEKARSA